MKILVLSLLRLGDIIQQEPVLRALRERYPHAQIHLLINKQFASVEKILKGVVDQYIYFDREGIQKGLGEASFHILWSYTEIENLIRQLDEQNYAMAINLTHNKLSAYLLGALKIPDKMGLYQEEGRFQGLNNKWIRYFNDRFSGKTPSVFHYVELLGNSFGLTVTPPAKIERKKSKTILFQCLTSEARKNWGLENFMLLKQTIEIGLVDYKVKVLGASFEREILEQVFSSDDLIICDLKEVRKHLQDAALLVTGDTSIKHLAAQVGTPLIEIALGNSDPMKTGAYANDVLVHCEVNPADVKVEDVFQSVWSQLSAEQIRNKNFERDFERGVWKFYLDNSQAQADYAKAIHSMTQSYSGTDMQAAFSVVSQKTIVFKEWLKQINEALPEKSYMLSKKSITSTELSDLILCAQNILKSKKDPAGYFQGFIEALLSPYSSPIQLFDRVTAALAQIEELMVIRASFEQYLGTYSKEGVYYAKGIGQLSVSGFEEARESSKRNLEDAGL